MRYRLRTLLMVLAVGPLLVALFGWEYFQPRKPTDEEHLRQFNEEVRQSQEHVQREIAADPHYWERRSVPEPKRSQTPSPLP